MIGSEGDKMIKNIILDIGGVIFDDGNKNLQKVLNVSEEETKKLSKIAFGGDFKSCLLGKLNINDHIKRIKQEYSELSNKLEYILSPENYNKTFPLMKTTLNLMLKLKEQGYKIYLLSNITEASFKYINDTIDLDKYIDGGLYSYQEKMAKPDYKFYKKLFEKYNISKDESIFFDDKAKNVEAGNEVGVKSVLFKSIEDIKKNI